MNGFALLLGHLVGDYIFQTDWMATNKTLRGSWKTWKSNWIDGDVTHVQSPDSNEKHPPGSPAYDDEKEAERAECWRVEWMGHFACTIHCLFYTLAIGMFAFRWMPLWGYWVCFLTHWPIDRWRLARVFMKYTWHEKFATGPLSPWSIIITDNILHLAVLFSIALFAGVK